MKEKFNINDWVQTPNQQANDTEKQSKETKKSYNAKNANDYAILNATNANDYENLNAKNANGYENLYAKNANQTSKLYDLETLVSKLEEEQMDITQTYSNWRNIGFAFADELGESGRDLYHRVSKFHAEYDENECNKQFDKCLKSKGHGININTFFYLAKKAGIKISNPKKTIETKPKEMPTFPDSVFTQLPAFLQNVTMHTNSNEERDILLLGSIVCLSACLPNVYGIYGNSKVYPNLYVFVTGKASAGKGILNHCKNLVNPVHKNLREQATKAKQSYEIELVNYNQSKSSDSRVQKPTKPPEMMLYIPANNSSTGAYELLADSNGNGLIFETEGDTLAQSFKSDYGNYSDGFRKAFHHETISYFRRKDKEFVEIEKPCISAMLSGTPRQITSLIPNSENGLFSRFMFYYMNTKQEWIDVFANSESGVLEDYFKGLGDTFFEYYKYLKSTPPICFKLTVNQQKEFNQYFTKMQQKYLALLGDDFIGSIRRLGLITFRLSMIFSVLRSFEDGDIANPMICKDEDFQAALSIIQILIKHSSHIFSELPEETQLPILKTTKEQFLDALPPTFNRQDFLKLGDTLGINPKTAEGYIGQFKKKGLIHHPQKDNYTKVA